MIWAPLSDVLVARDSSEWVGDPGSETFVTVRMRGGGAVKRSIGEGKTPRPFRGQRVRAGDVIYSRIDARNGAFALLGAELDGAVVSKDFPTFGVRADRIETAYLSHLIRLPQFSARFQAMSFGATNRQRIDERLLLAQRIPLPPLPEQRRIAAILDEADALRRQASAATALAADLMRSEGNAPAGQSIPLGRCVTISSGKSIVGSEDSDSSARVLKISAVTSGVFSEAESKPLPSGYEPPSTHLVHAGDLLVSRANTTELVGASAFVYDEPSRPVALPDKLWRLTVDQALADPAFLHSEISSAAFRAEVSRRATGSGGSMKNIGQSQFLSIPVRLPPLRWQRQFAIRVSKLRAVQTRSTARAHELDALFASLQHRAFRGEL